MMSVRCVIRAEAPEDVKAVREINELAFQQPDEAAIVDRLRQEVEGLLSLVAMEEDLVVGHILFSPVAVETGAGQVAGMGLAPMAVHPLRQRQGIGSALVRRGLGEVRATGCPFVAVLGHPEYYPRFGFERASHHGLQCQWEEVPDEAFMVIVFDLAAMEEVHGVLHYADVFSEAV